MSISRRHSIQLLGTSLLGIPNIIKGFSSDDSPNFSHLKPNSIPLDATIGLVAPASPIYDESDFDQMLIDLAALGYNLVLGDHVRDRYGYLAGKDQDRADDLNRMFSNPSIDAIVCVRGGYGCNRILDLVDYDVIRSNPKPFIGFSDITSLHMAIYKKTGLITFHGPVGKSVWPEYTRESWVDILHEGESPTFSIPVEEIDASYTINSGKASGVLIGGNLTVLTSLLGSDYLPEFDNAILFLEDVGEDIYRVDRMFSQLKLSGVLNKINGLVFGKCTNCDESSNGLSLKQVFDDYLSEIDIPAFYGAMISHEELNLTIPVGVQATIDGGAKTIELLEPGTLK
ncbi:MAG: LD-carboxypeptidase [Balneolaceae bacterium]|nr:LD-carboxypeptidase [Balneolaceae bacterium]